MPPEDEEAPEVDETTEADDGDEGQEPEGADQLGDPGKKALQRMKEQLREEKRLRKEAEAKAAQASKPKPADGDQSDVEAIRRQAREEAAAEALKERVLDKIEAKAGRFVDAEDAAALLMRGRDIDEFVDGGKVDTAAIAEALEELAQAKPHLVARNGSTGGSFDTGRGKQAEKAQLTRADLAKMTPAQIEQARKSGRLDRLMGKSK